MKMTVRKGKAKKYRRCGNVRGKRHRGSGNRGGVGRAGVGKRGKQKKQKFLGELGKRGLKPKSNKLKVINVSELVGGEELRGYKLLGKGVVKSGVVVKVSAASRLAVEKVEKAGGRVEFFK